MTRGRAPRRRVVAGAGAALALLAGSPSAARPFEHVPAYRYYMVTRTDTKPHAIRGSFHYEMTHHEAFAIDWVLATYQGRQYVFDQGWVMYSPHADAAVGGQATPTCMPSAVCTVDRASVTHPVHVPFPVFLDYVIVTRDTVLTVDLSKSPDKHWKVTELKGDPRVTGQVHVRMPSDGDVTSVTVGGWTFQQLRDIGYPGGRYGSIAMGIAPYHPLTYGLTTMGSARLDGGQKYTQDLDTIEGNTFYVSGWSPGPTTWRLHGDRTTVATGGGPVMYVYDLPEPKALKAYLRKS